LYLAVQGGWGKGTYVTVKEKSNVHSIYVEKPEQKREFGRIVSAVRMKLREILQKWCVRMRAEFTWIRELSSGQLLWTQYLVFWYYKR
jgi:hypothetical protein